MDYSRSALGDQDFGDEDPDRTGPEDEGRHSLLETGSAHGVNRDRQRFAHSPFAAKCPGKDGKTLPSVGTRWPGCSPVLRLTLSGKWCRYSSGDAKYSANPPPFPLNPTKPSFEHAVCTKDERPGKGCQADAEPKRRQNAREGHDLPLLQPRLHA